MLRYKDNTQPVSFFATPHTLPLQKINNLVILKFNTTLTLWKHISYLLL